MRINKVNLLYITLFLSFIIFLNIISLFELSSVKKELKQYNKTNTEIIEDLEWDLEYKSQDFNKMSPDTGLWYAMDYLNIMYKDIVYAQAVLETGYFSSRVCIDYNNLFGLYNSRIGDYYHFNHWAESVLAYKLYIQDKYDYSNNNEEYYYKFLQELPYAEDSNYIDKIKLIVKKVDKKWLEN